MGPPRRRRRQRASSRSTSSTPDKQQQGRRAQARARGRRRALPRHRRGPRGRGHRLAPARGAQAPTVPVRRMVFHEITRDAIRAAAREHRATSTSGWSTPRRPGASSTGSTATRSRPVLWKKVMPGLSAGRVQSRRHPPRRGARAGADRVRRRAATGTSRARARPAAAFTARPGRARRAPRRDRPRLRRPDGRLPRRPTSSRLDEAAPRVAGRRAARARRSRCAPSSEKPYRRSPAAPFMTSTLQQEASRKLRFSAQTHDAGRAAAVRERLHHLHAHRLHDAVGDGDRRGARASARRSSAPEYVAERRASTPARSRTPRRRTRRSARPATRSARPARSPASSSADELALYDLIWKRTVASPDGRRPRHDA